MKIRYTLIISFSIIVLALLAASIGNVNPDSVGTTPLTDDILRSKMAFAVVDEEIANHLNLGVLTKHDYQKLHGPVLLEIRTPIHTALREQFGKIVDSVNFGAQWDSGSPSGNPTIIKPDKPVLHKKAAEIIRDFIEKNQISVIIRSDALIGIGETAVIRGLRGEVRYTYELINSACVIVPIKNLAALIKRPFITEIWPNAKGRLKLQDSVPQIGADKVHNPHDAFDANDRGLGVTGKGVRVAVVDGGIDVHEAFTSGSSSRIVADRISNLVPTILQAREHGTHVAGIIGADADNNGVSGVAPEVLLLDAEVSGLAIVTDNLFTFKPTYGDVIKAINWAVENNTDVINMSMGWDPWFYGRDGRDPMSELIDKIVDDGIVSVVSAGNEAYRRTIGTISPQTQHEEHGFWVSNNSFIDLDRIEVTLAYDQNNNNNNLDLIILDSNKREVYFSRSPSLTDHGTVYKQIAIPVAKIGSYLSGLYVKVEGFNVQDSQDYEVWINAGYFNNANSEETVVTPGYSEKTITVGAVYSNNEIADFSSRGFFNTGLIKPEIVAPGVEIYSTLNSFLGKKYGDNTGTSMAAPHVAGVAALILDAVGKNNLGEWNFSPDEVKSAIVRGAERGGNIPNTPDNEYGAGLVKADNIIFGGTVPAQGELRFEITPQLIGSWYDGSFLNAENTFPAEGRPFLKAAISWEDSKHNLDLVLSDANGKVLGTSNEAQSNYEKISTQLLPLPVSYYLVVTNKSEEDVLFTGASIHPIKPATISIRPDSDPTSLADIVLIIDSSGSMQNEDPDNLRKSGAKLFITSADPKVQIAIVDFEASARKLASLTFADTAGKVALENAVDHVHSSGSSTNIDAGLQQGFQELDASTSTAKKAAVLLTDGQGRVEQDVIQKYAAKGWPIYTIGLGSGVDRAELEGIAHATGGEYFEASKANLQTVYNKILAKTTYQSVIASLTGYINKGQQIVKKVSIDGTLKKVYFGSDWQGSTIELVLIDPDGTQITPQDAATNPSITYQSAPTYAIYTIDNPKPGDWQMQATGTDIPAGGEPFNLTVNATSDYFTNFLAFNSRYAVGDTIRIGIEIEERIGDTFAPVLGATTSAKIIRPDGKIDTLTLFDDGSHNDVAANDGKYANDYSTVDKRGTYLIIVSAENGFSREIQEQVVVGDIHNVFIDGSTLTPAAGTTLKQTPNVISAVISGPAGRINASSIVLKVDGGTVTHTYNQVNQLVSYRPVGLSGGSHDVQLSVQDVSGNKIETTWSFSTQGIGAVTTRTILTGHTGGVTSVAFSPDGQTIASGSQDNTVWLWDAATDTSNLKLIGHTGGVTSVAFSSDRQTIASASEDNTVRLWDINTGTELKKITGHTGPVYSVAFSPDGQKLASGGADNTVRIWDVNTGTQLGELTRHTGAVFSVAFSPDEQKLASGGADNTVRIWDVNTGTQLGRLTGHTGAVFSVAFSQNETIASGGVDGTLHLWDVNTGTQRQIFTGHRGPVYSVAFSPDGQNLASGSSDQTALLWGVNPGTQPQILTGHTDAVLSVVFSLDGQKLASGSRDNTVRLWGSAPDVQPPELTADVNGDGVVDIQDLRLVYANLGKYGQNDADVNGDGIVNAEDIILVSAAIEAAAGAPALHTQARNLFTAEEVQQWLTEARGLADKSPAHRRGIAVLEQLLTLLTPKETALLPNYPNPFNPETWVPYQLAKPADVTLTIYDINGSVVRALDLGHRHAGMYHNPTRAAYWDGKNRVGEPVASGVYFYTLKAGDFSATRKMLVRK